MQLDDRETHPAAGSLVQTIDILGDQGEGGEAFFQLNQRQMPGIRGGSADQLSAPGIPFPDQARIAAKGFGRGQLFRSEALPKTGLSIPKGRHSAFGGDAGSGQDDQMLRLPELPEQPIWKNSSVFHQSGCRTVCQ